LVQSVKESKKKYARESELPTWNDVAIRKDCSPPYILEAIWVDYIQNMMSMRFTQQSQSGTENRHQRIHDSITTHTRGSILFVLHVKHMVRFFITFIFHFLFFINIFLGWVVCFNLKACKKNRQ
jgi:hypothetical protein